MSDPYFSSVVSLLHFDGADGAQVFTDEIGNTWTAYRDGGGDPTIITSTSQKKFGASSCYTPWPENSRINTPDSTAMRMGVSDFTIEAWFLRDVNVTEYGFFFVKGNNTSGGILLGVNSTGAVWRRGAGGEGDDLHASVSIPDDEWTHVAFVREGVERRIYVNGTLEASDSDTVYDYNSSEEARLGAAVFDYATFDYYGYIDEFRITKAARYTDAFSPPTSAFPSSASGGGSVRRGAAGQILLAEFRFDGGYYVQRVATDWWYSQHNDSIGVQEWQGRITSEPTFSIELGCIVWGNKTAVGIGSIDVADPAGELDWMQRRTRDATCILRLALPGQSYDETIQVARCIVDNVEMDGDVKRVNLRGVDTLLDRPLQSTVYASAVASSDSITSSQIDFTDVPPANNAAHNAVIEGNRVPVVLGDVWQHEPVLTDPSQLLFQITDAGIVDIDAVLSGGSVANPPDSNGEDWDYASLRAGFQMSTDPAARITVNCSGIRALGDSIISDDLSAAASWSSDGPDGWSVVASSGRGVAIADGVGALLTADAGESSGPTISKAIAASEGDWVVALLDVVDITEGYLTVSVGSPREIRREGRHALIMPVGAAADLEIAAVPSADGADITIASVYLYPLSGSTGTESLVEMMRHITLARGAIPGAITTIESVIAEGWNSSDSPDTWTEEIVGVASIAGGAGVVTISAGDGATNSVARITWPTQLMAGERYTLAAGVDITSISGRAGFAGVQAFFRPVSLVPSSYISLGLRTTAGAESFAVEFEPTEAGYLVFEIVAGDQEEVVTEIDSITLTRTVYDDDGATVDFESLAAIDAGYTFGLVSEGAETARETAQRLLDSVAGWIYPDPSGRIRFGQLATPSGAATLTVSAVNMVSVPIYTPDLATGLSDTLAGARNWSPYADTELTGITYPDRPPYRADYRAKRRGASADNLARPYTHAIGAEPIPTYIYSAANTQTEADRITAIYLQQRGFWTVDVALESAAAAAAVRPDRNVILDSSLFGDDDGKLAKIVGVEGRYGSQVLTLKLWGATNA